MYEQTEMRVAKTIGKYSEEQARKYLRKAVPFIILFAVLLITSWNSLPIYIDFGRFEPLRHFLTGVVLTYSLFGPVAPYLNFRSGRQGEKRVQKNLSDKLSDEYSLYNDVMLRGERGGNIDHIIVGPTGIFVIETKNNDGHITYDRYGWKGLGETRNPTNQVNNNMFRVKKALGERFYVNPIVVFSNPKANLEIESEPKCDCRILQIKAIDDPSLADLIKNAQMRFSDQEIKEIEQCLENSIGNWADRS